ncbi:sodium/calcium exchanger 1-like isoform X1 [Mercenaria mercenaria]|uniref:sodium/calcium exchanger 1-like isoform X1 n=1 Tax=Mercenaria mercenaria TaxID=6596 RepID=UPI001E1D9198|nr:sodium/calcium exchanger 1-like isoform X1 [Mercenaria mercenaria]
MAGYVRISILLVLGITISAQFGTAQASNKTCTRESEECRKGMIIPMWEPVGDLSPGDKAARAIVYMAAMIYMFLGVSIIADRFMASIEVITSKEKDVTVKRADGSTQVVSVRIWNETVSNLTLMALGSSAPEILLSVIEIVFMNNFKAGDLGPSTIVGSAAFNLFIIMALCVSCLPGEEVRRVKHLRVFTLTATWSIFAYLWLYFILSVSSYGVVHIWEAVVTFLFFPLTVFTAYVADKQIFVYKFLSKKYRSSKQRGVVISSEGDTELGKANHVGDEVVFKGLESQDSDVREFENHRKEFMEILRDLRKKNPNTDMKTLEEMAELEAINRGPKSRAFYRIQATRKLTGSGNVIKKSKIEKKASLEDVRVDFEDEGVTRVFFDPGHYTVMENVGTFNLTVSRAGGDLSKTLYVDFKTEDGTANAGSDYEYTEGTLIFYPNEVHKQFPLTVIDDDLFEEDEHLYVRLSNLRLGDADGTHDSTDVKLGTPFLATVMILDDDHPGIFHFEDKELRVSEAIGEVNIKVMRSSGARGTVKVPYFTKDGSAKGGKDYEPVQSELIFTNDETEKYISIRIYDDEEYEKNEEFFVELGEPSLTRRGSEFEGEDNENDEEPAVHFLRRKTAGKGKSPDADSGAIINSTEDEQLQELGKPRLGDLTKIQISIKESQEFKSVVDKLLKKANVSLVVGTSSWREQFIEAITVSPGDEDEEESEEKLPSCSDYVMHFLTLFWKVLFALIPPTDYWGGWACFSFSIVMIGVLTAFIGDLASSFGCTIGLKDAITAISFVALGTSVPDTFASKVAAVNDRYADSSIGNVTGSNAVNVFLGIGIAWTIAAVYHAAIGEVFEVDPGTLAFSVTLFCIEGVCCIAILLIRRVKAVGGELGGPKKYRIPTTIFFIFLWVFYIVMSSMVAYCYVPGF